MKTVSIVSLGCPKNLIDSEVMLGILEKEGYVISDKANASDIVIVNTCSFIEKSTRESVDKIVELAELKKKNKLKILIVSGCLPQKYKSSGLPAELSEVDAFVGTGNFHNISVIIKKIISGERLFEVASRPSFLYNDSYSRHVLTPHHYVYVKIAEGCQHRCSYCLIPQLRGAYRSREMPSIVKEIKNLSYINRLSEINLIAQDSTAYGTDIYGSRKLVELMKKIARLKVCRWLRLMYTHPAHFDDNLIEFIRKEAKVCKYIDLPLQHINDEVLKKMGRKITKKEIVALIQKLRDRVPGIAVRTSFIAGFPQETEKQFNELLEFVREMSFDRVGVFEYSREKGTRAYALSGQVPEAVKKERFRKLMIAQQKVSAKKNRSFIGRKLEVLVDGISEDKKVLLVRTYRDAPEIDGYVLIKQGKAKSGDFLKVEITGANAYDMTGKII